MKSDEEYLYLRINKKDLDINNDEIIIPIDVTQKSGSNNVEGYKLTFNKDADFIIKINGKDNSTIEVQNYYDINDFLFNYKIKKRKIATNLIY